jgi:F-type H+-transporting ATPase subunit delta
MLISKTAKRYARALFERSVELNNGATLLAEMKDLKNILASSKDLNILLDSPFVSASKKLEISKTIFAQFSAEFNNFVALCIKNKRESILGQIANDFIQRTDAASGLQYIKLTLAAEIAQQGIQDILAQSKMVDQNKPTQIQTEIKPEILGGYVLRVGDLQIDQSIKSKLNGIKKEFQLN